jgi:hypothetical protein
VWGRIAYAIVVGASIPECREALDSAEAALEIRLA